MHKIFLLGLLVSQLIFFSTAFAANNVAFKNMLGEVQEGSKADNEFCGGCYLQKLATNNLGPRFSGVKKDSTLDWFNNNTGAKPGTVISVGQ